MSADKTEEVPKLHRKNTNWEQENSSGSLEGIINRFEQELRIEFGTLQKRKSSNVTNTENKFESHEESSRATSFVERQKSRANRSE